MHLRNLLRTCNKGRHPIQRVLYSVSSSSIPSAPTDNLNETYQPGTIPELPTMAEFERHWIYFFKHRAYDSFEVQRGLNNCFSYDMVPTISVLEEALRACRRVDSLATALRLFGAMRDKLTKESDYDDYKRALQPIMTELGVISPEEFGRFD
jgi:cytochrome c oxidase subunit 5a